MRMHPPSLQLSGEAETDTLSYSWMHQSMLTLLPLRMQDQWSQSHMHNMDQATQQRHEPTLMQSTRKEVESTT